MAIDIQALSDALPSMAESLGKMMVVDGLSIYRKGIITLEQGTPAVSIVYYASRSGRPLKVTLSVDFDDAEEDDA